MKKVMFLSLMATFLIACTPDQDKFDHQQLVNVPKSDAPGVIPNEVGLTAIVSLPNEHTWQDLDEFYKTELPKFSGTDYYDNLRELVLYHLVYPFKIQTNADKETLAYYFGEMQEVELMNPDAFLAVASALFLKGWSKEEVREAARVRYEKNMETFRSLDNFEEALAKYGDKHEKLLRYSRNFPNRWGAY